MPSGQDAADGSRARGPSSRQDGDEELSDDVLMERVARGDARAFASLVSRCLERVLATARRLLGNDADAEEVAQEAFLRLWRHAGAWQPGRARVSTWLYRVTSNLAIDRLRAPRPAPVPEVPEVPIPPAQMKGMEQRALARRMDGALQKLPERQRVALVLFHYEEQSMADVASIMSVSVEAVESLLARGRRALKTELKGTWRDWLPEDGDR